MDGSLLSNLSIAKGNGKLLEELARKELKDPNLFLINGFRNVISSEFAQLIRDAILNDIVVIPYFNLVMGEKELSLSQKEILENGGS